MGVLKYSPFCVMVAMVVSGSGSEGDHASLCSNVYAMKHSHTKTSCMIIQDSYMNLASRHLHSVSAYHLASFLQDCCKIIMILAS